MDLVDRHPFEIASRFKSSSYLIGDVAVEFDSVLGDCVLELLVGFLNCNIEPSFLLHGVCNCEIGIARTIDSLKPGGSNRFSDLFGFRSILIGLAHFIARKVPQTGPTLVRTTLADQNFVAAFQNHNGFVEFLVLNFFARYRNRRL